MDEEGINKLVELLNEREKELDPNIQVERTEFSVGINKWYLISKEYGFIKWLVDNDKIDLENLIIKKVEDRGGNKVIKDIKYYSEVESLLMILSIQDNPIEYLCSILKE